MHKKHILASLLMTSVLASASWALEIPLSGTGQGGKSERIGYVDMERIFQIYPQTKNAKEDYMKKRNTMREDLEAKEAQLEDIKQRLAILESSVLTQAQQPPDSLDPLFENNSSSPAVTGEAPITADAVTKTKQELENLQFEYEEARKRSEEDLIAFENQQTQIILGKIYIALRDLAQEEQVDLVVDKSSILFGSTDIDLTDKLQRKVRGF